MSMAGAFDRGASARALVETLACAARAATPQPLAPFDGPTVRGMRCDAEAQCYDGFHVTGDVIEDLAVLAGRCGDACGMAALTTVREEIASSAEEPHVYAIELEATACYRFFAVADDGIDVLAAAIATPAGDLVAIDNSRDRAPILGPRAPFCPSEGGRYRLVVAAVGGAGRFAFQGWSRPRTSTDM
jgi:hypothetical protein